jgi:hypothetical protein
MDMDSIFGMMAPLLKGSLSMDLKVAPEYLQTFKGRELKALGSISINKIFTEKNKLLSTGPKDDYIYIIFSTMRLHHIYVPHYILDYFQKRGKYFFIK